MKLAHFPQATASQMVVALEDGRAVVGVNVSGRVRLMAVATARKSARRSAGAWAADTTLSIMFARSLRGRITPADG
ncbi:MAG: hypothetical protein M3545_16285 [Acidobacteriota bacterium]|nr:hypothetical protein [Acidobacteriota bacterium]